MIKMRIMKDCYESMSNEDYIKTASQEPIKVKEMIHGTNEAIVTIINFNNRKLNVAVNTIISRYVKHIITIKYDEGCNKTTSVGCIDLYAMPNRICHQLIEVSKKIKEKEANHTNRK